MKLSVRALLAVSMLVGVLVLVVTLVAAVALGARAVVDDGQRGYGVFRFVLFALLLAAAAAWSMARSLLKGQPALPGVPLPRESEPALWAEVDRVAASVGTRGPDGIRLLEQANAAVVEDARPFRPGRRTLLLGAPLLVCLDIDQLRAVLAHELGHYSARHTTLARLTYRGQEVLGDLVLRLGPRTLVGRLLDLYGRLYLRVAGAVSRSQELEADRLAAQVSGAAAAAEAVAAVPEVAAAWHHFRRGDVLSAEERGRRPERLLLVFGDLWRNPASRDSVTGTSPRWEPPPSPYDTHPSTEDRVARLRSMVTGVPASDPRPALELLEDAGSTLAAVEAVMYDGSRLVPTPWPDLLAEKAAADAAGAARQLGWSARQEKLAERATVGVLLELVEAGEGPRLAGRFLDRTAPVLVRQMTLATLLRRTLEHAAVERLGLRHVAGEDGRPVLHAPDGTPLPPRSLVEAAAREPSAVPSLRAWAERHDLLDRPLLPA